MKNLDSWLQEENPTLFLVCSYNEDKQDLFWNWDLSPFISNTEQYFLSSKGLFDFEGQGELCSMHYSDLIEEYQDRQGKVPIYLQFWDEEQKTFFPTQIL